MVTSSELRGAFALVPPSSDDDPGGHLELVRAVVDAEGQHIAQQYDVIRWRLPGSDCHLQEHVGGGATTLITGPLYSEKLNHTVGAGVNGPLTPEDLEIVERLYEQVGLSPTLYLCNYADQTAYDLMAEGGYVPDRTIVHLFYRLDGEKQQTKTGGDSTVGKDRMKVEVREEKDRNLFVTSSVEGFRDGGRAPELLEALANCAVDRSDTTLFTATIDGEVAGTAAMALFETAAGKVVNLYIDSTLPAFRGRGLHQAMIDARLAHARKLGCVMAIASARAGSGSARNFEKAGYRLAYTSLVCTKQKQ